jgi:hypothetical protein
LNVSPSESVRLEAQCVNPDSDLDHATWEVRRPGEDRFEEVTRDDVQLQEDPWGPKSRSFTFTEEGTAAVRWTCVDQAGASDTAEWSVTLETPRIRTLFSDTISTLPSLTVGVSEQGSLIGVGRDDGDVTLYQDDGSSDRLQFRSISSVSHLKVSETLSQINLAWLDDNLFGAVTTDGADQWAYQFADLWDVDWNSDRTVTAAVSNPTEGPGSLGYGVEGEIQWTKEFDNALGWSVAVSENGEYVAVGTDRYWEGTERKGTPSVRLYDAQGELLWSHQTETGVISVAIHSSRDLVLAGTDGGKLLAFDLDGERLWSDEGKGGWIHLSKDGSTIATGVMGDVVALDTNGTEKWRTSVEGLSIDAYLHLSTNGSKVLAIAKVGGNATLIDQGETLWSKSYDGPIGGDLSEDGDTWGIARQDSEGESTRVFAYRDSR